MKVLDEHGILDFRNPFWILIALWSRYTVLCSGRGGGGGRREIFNMYAFGVHLRYVNLSNIMLGISNSLFNYCNVTITLYAYILVCFLVPLAPKQRKL